MPEPNQTFQPIHELAKYRERIGSSQMAIAHELLAINLTMRLYFHLIGNARRRPLQQLREGVTDALRAEATGLEAQLPHVADLAERMRSLPGAPISQRLHSRRIELHNDGCDQLDRHIRPILGGPASQFLRRGLYTHVRVRLWRCCCEIDQMR